MFYLKINIICWLTAAIICFAIGGRPSAGETSRLCQFFLPLAYILSAGLFISTILLAIFSPIEATAR